VWWALWAQPLQVSALPSASRCGACHPSQLQGWSDSGHRRAWTEPLFQAGFFAEPQLWCANCHAPLPEMRAEVAANLDWYAWQAPGRPRFGPAPERAPEPRAEEGVSCVACHQPDGGPVRGPDGEGSTQHAVIQSEVLVDGTVCRGCHEFPMPRWDNGVQSFTETPMQSTWSEWQAWKAQGGKASCIDCHMPGGSHAVRGVHDRDWLAASVEVVARRRGDTLLFVLRGVGVGHALPSGDLFRHLTLEVEQDGTWREIAWLGRRFEVQDPGGLAHKVLAEDTSLQPGEPRRIEFPSPSRTRWRLRWHDGAAHDEERGWVDLESIVVTLHEGEG
jgi:hypothetical protein